ncbi:MAG: NAD(P)/FAD-dependent oxidoreductase [Rhodospirillales bacterium]|nr:NAD(P)/FAD-dependent oxidoreductase [Rhodospirillales bacterium]
MVERCECVVVGAGAVGLAIAHALAATGREVIVLEAAETFGTVTSSRNSEVIHAGLYYPPGSLKARFCRRGRDLLYPWLRDHGIEHLRCEKLVVATDEAEVDQLRGVQARALANGVEDIRWISADEARSMEPEVRCLAALHSPSTGIFDSHGYMLSLKGAAEALGAMFAFHSRVASGSVREDGILLRVETGGSVGTNGTRGDESFELLCNIVVNSAGLGAQALSRAIDGLSPASVPPLHYSKGCYFSLAGRPPFQRLVYPPPEHASIGLHYTRDLAGRGRFGPDAQWVESVEYTVDAGRAEQFYASIRRYWPGLKDGALAPDYAGIRPKIQAPGEVAVDFVIHGPETHGVPNLIALYGIESPGLTSSLAIADHVAERLNGA